MRPILQVWHLIVHIMGLDYGVAYGHLVWYNFWSGIAGSFLVGVIAYVVLWYWHHTCHASWKCLRYGKYDAAGGMFKLCAKHHPDIQGRKITAELIHELHLDHKRRIGGHQVESAGDRSPEA